MEPQIEFLQPIQTEQAPKPPFTLPMTIFLALFLSAGLLSFLFVPQKQVTQQVVVDEMEGWKTYRNEEYGFEFKYPANNDFYDMGVNVSEGVSWGENFLLVAEIGLSKDGPYSVMAQLNIVKNTNQDLFPESDPSRERRISEQEMFINNINWIIVENEILYAGGIDFYKMAGYRDDNFTYYLTTSSDKENFDKILSTFKFINIDEDENNNGIWDYVEEYINSEYSSSEKLRMALYQYTKSQQDMISKVHDRETGGLYVIERDKASDCIRYIDPENGYKIRQDLLLNVIINTDEKAGAYLEADRYLGGSYQNTPEDRLKLGCNFDPDKLPN